MTSAALPPTPQNDPPVVLSTVHGEWNVIMPAMKLSLRARLPGASAFDEAARGLQSARKAGVAVETLLASAFASSWLVNSAVPSPVFQKWLALRNKWVELIALIEGGDSWMSRPKDVRASIEALLAEIAAAGATLGGITKVLSTLCLRAVPLMPDAALAHVLRALPTPKEPDAQTAPVTHFCAMMDRLHASTENAEPDALAALVKRAAPTLRPQDVFDRLVWFESVGFRHFKNDHGGWYWIRSESKEGVVFVNGAAPEGHRVGACIDVPGEDDFSTRAYAVISSALPDPEHE